MIGPGRSGLEVTQHRIDPLEARHAGALAGFADDFGFMLTAGLADARETIQTVGDNCCRCCQVIPGPAFDFGEAERLDPGKHRADRMPSLVGLDGSDEADLVFRATARLRDHGRIT